MDFYSLTLRLVSAYNDFNIKNRSDLIFLFKFDRFPLADDKVSLQIIDNGETKNEKEAVPLFTSEKRTV